MSSTLESEDLEHVQLVRMEDVQPSRERLPDHLYTTAVKEEDLETCIVDSLDYDNECVVDDDDSNIGSMVSIHSEEINKDEDIKEDEDIEEQDEEIIEEDISEVVEDNETNSFELIVPEALNPRKVVVDIDLKPPKAKKQAPESWPTLEILPGGVINHIEKCEYESQSDTKEVEAEGGDMYACAKCSRTFKHLFCLVKHVRGHEKQKKQEEPDLSKLSVCTRTTKSTRPSKIRVATSQKEVPTKWPLEKEILKTIKIRKSRSGLDKSYKTLKVKVLARMAEAMAKIGNVEDIS